MGELITGYLLRLHNRAVGFLPEPSVLSKLAVVFLVYTLTLLCGQPTVADSASQHTQDVRVYKIQVDYTTTIRYVDARGEVQEKSVQCAREFVFDPPISFEEALPLVDSACATGVSSHDSLIHDVTEACSEPCCGVWCCWLGRNSKEWTWKPDENSHLLQGKPVQLVCTDEKGREVLVEIPAAEPPKAGDTSSQETSSPAPPKETEDE